MVPGGDDQQGCGIRADAVAAEQAGSPGGHERDDQLVQAGGLVLEELHTPASLRSATRSE